MLSVIVPAHAEGDRIRVSLGVLVSALDALSTPYEVVVVSDGNVDDTAEEARGVGYPAVRVLEYETQRGKGHALRHGFAASSGDTVAFIDADMELHPSGIGRLLALLDTAQADVVVGSKIHPESIVEYPRFRRIQSEMYRRLVRLLFRLDVRDTQTGLKVFRRAPLDAVMSDLRSDGFAFDLELLVAVNDLGFRIVEGPIELDYKFSTTTDIRAAARVLVDTLRIAWRRRIARNRSSVASSVR